MYDDERKDVNSYNTYIYPGGDAVNDEKNTLFKAGVVIYVTNLNVNTPQALIKPAIQIVKWSLSILTLRLTYLVCWG